VLDLAVLDPAKAALRASVDSTGYETLVMRCSWPRWRVLGRDPPPGSRLPGRRRPVPGWKLVPKQATRRGSRGNVEA
jgi:hypothetical protein